MNAILYLSKTSCQWRMIPKNFPPTIHNKQATSNERSKVSASHGGFPRPPWRSVKKNRAFPVKNEKMFERSEFFSFRGMPDFLASERQPAVFLLQTFSLAHKEKAPSLTVPPKTSQSPPLPVSETHAGGDYNEGHEAPPPVPDNR